MNSKISALNPASALLGGEEIPLVQLGVTVKTTPADILTYINANQSTPTLQQVLTAGSVLTQNNDITGHYNLGLGTNTSPLLGLISAADVYDFNTDQGVYSKPFFYLDGSLDIWELGRGTGNITGNATGQIIYDSPHNQFNGVLLNINSTNTKFGQLTANRALILDSSNYIQSSSVTDTELGYLSGATSNIQNQLNNLMLGFGGWKKPARILLNTNVNISSPGATLDGITMSAGDRFVANGQTTGSQNGVYDWNGAAVPATRSSDCTTGGTGSTGVLGMVITIEQGTYADQLWVLNTDAPITIGTTALTYSKGSATTYTGSNGISLSGNNFTFDYTFVGGDITMNSGGVVAIGSSKVTNAMLAGSIANAKLLNSTISGISLGSNLAALTIGTGLSGSSYNGSAGVTIAIDSTVLTTTGAQTVTNKRRQPRVFTTASTSTLTPEIDTYDLFHITALAAALTIANHSTSTPADGEQMKIRILDNGTARAISFGTNYVAKAGVSLPTTTTISKNMEMIFEWNANLSKWNLMAVGSES